MSKYKQAVDEMVAANKELFDNFKEIHDEFALNPDAWQKLLNEYGAEVVEVIRDYERKLCIKMGTGKYGQFSQNLSQKFWDEVRKIFPKIDFVGVKIQ